jgi:DNA-binding IclR family transcriptional regulator
VGKALLAFAPREVVTTATQHLTAYTANTLHTSDRLQRALGIVRLTRSAMAHGELVAGESAVAVPVFGCGGEVIAALEVELHDLRADLERCKPALVVAARGLSRELAVDHDRVDRPRLRLVPASDGIAAP